MIVLYIKIWWQINEHSRPCRISPRWSSEIATRIFKANGSSDEEAIRVADDLVESNLAGVDDHGVAMIPLLCPDDQESDKPAGVPIPRHQDELSGERRKGFWTRRRDGWRLWFWTGGGAQSDADGDREGKDVRRGDRGDAELGPYRQAGRISDADGAVLAPRFCDR